MATCLSLAGVDTEHSIRSPQSGCADLTKLHDKGTVVRLLAENNAQPQAGVNGFFQPAMRSASFPHMLWEKSPFVATLLTPERTKRRCFGCISFAASGETAKVLPLSYLQKNSAPSEGGGPDDWTHIGLIISLSS